MMVMEILVPTRSHEVLRSEVSDELKEVAKRISPEVYEVVEEKKVEAVE